MGWKGEDGNAPPSSNDLVGWQKFHEFLQSPNMTHPLVKPQYQGDDNNDKTTTYQSCTDESLWAIRRDHLDFLYPHSLHRQENYYANAMRVWHLMEKCFPAGMMVTHQFITRNPEHRYFTKGMAATVDAIAAEIFQQDPHYSRLEPWPHVDLRQRCNVKETPPIAVDPQCKAATEARFKEWLEGTG